MNYHRGKPAGEEWEHVSKRGGSKWKCLYCDKYFHGSATRIRAHLAGNSNDINVCPKVPKEVQDKFVNISKEKEEDAHQRKRKRVLEKLSTEKDHKTASQVTLSQLRDKKERCQVDMAIADYIFSEGLPLSTTSKESFKLMVDTIRAAPLNYKLPSRAAVSSDILDRSYDQIQNRQVGG